MAKHLTTALVQLNVSDRPLENLSTTQAFIQSAADQGAELIATPECTNFIAANARDLAATLHLEGDDPTLLAIRAQAKALGVWILIGSLCLKNDTGTDAMAVNRQFFINPKGEIIGRYDKIHMFDVDVADGQTYRESAQYAAGNHLQTSRLEDLTLGHSICYDVRFPYLYSGLAYQGAGIIAVPAAFTHVTGQAHWETLLRARAIETGSWIIAPAQCGVHAGGRRTWGHSLIVDPWGRIVAQGKESEPGVILADIDPEQIKRARDSIPALKHYRTLEV